MHITLFFTHKASLKTWDSIGMFDREVAIYRKYLKKGVKISFVTYGRKDRKHYAERLEGIEILCNEFGLPTNLYSKLIPVLHANSLQRTNFIKSNQIPGAHTALGAAQFHKKAMLARCGYMHSEFIAKEHGADSAQAVEALQYEQKLFTSAQAIEVTTPMMQASIEERIPESKGKITVVPNYVDTDVFAPNEISKDIDLLYIGRLNPQKNLFALLDALKGLKLKTTIIGKGPLEGELKAKAEALNLNVQWAGNIPNTQLPDWLNRSRLFILPSFYEGHPKALIEAMAAGVPVIGANTSGIQEIITHQKTGCLTGTDARSIRNAIRELTASEALQLDLKKNAREFALAHYSLDTIVEKELALFESLLLY